MGLALWCFVVYSARRFVLCLALCYFILVFSVLLALRLPRLGKRELVFVLFVRFFDLRLFGFVCFLFLLVSGKGCGFCDCGIPLTFLLPFFGNLEADIQQVPLVQFFRNFHSTVVNHQSCKYSGKKN